MTETVKFVDGVNYTESDQADFNMNMRPQGILPESGLGVLNWSAIGGMFIRVLPGAALIRGFLYKNDANKDIAVGSNASGSTRIDTLVIRMNPTANTAVAQLVVGTPGAGAPALTQVVGGTWDFPLSDISVANGAATILAGNVTDRRSYSFWSANTLDAAMATDAEVAAAVAAAVNTVGVKLQANYALASDITGAALTVNTWNNVGGSVAFTVDRALSLISIDVQASAWLSNSGGTGSFFAWRLLIDGVTTRLMGGGVVRDSAKDNIHNPFIGAATVWFSGLSVGAHTVQLQINPDMSTVTIFCRPTTVIRECLFVQVVENMAG